MSWQPIETAPKDGTRVLLCGIPEYFPYETDEEFFIAIAFYDDHPGCWIPELANANDEHLLLPPSFWQPIPPPPSKTKEDA